MPRLIDADALIHVLVSLKEDYKKEGSSYRAKAVACLIKILQSKDISPTVEAEPVRHGEWIWDEKNECYVCSVCGEAALNNYRGLSVASNGCPHCLSKMYRGAK